MVRGICSARRSRLSGLSSEKSMQCSTPIRLRLRLTEAEAEAEAEPELELEPELQLELELEAELCDDERKLVQCDLYMMYITN